MANWFINFLSDTFTVVMVCVIAYFIFQIGLILYRKGQHNKSIGIEDNTTGFVKKLIQFATYVAGKLK